MIAQERKVFERREAYTVAQEIIERIKDTTEWIQIAGSLRRERPHVKDIELLFIPRYNTTFDLLGQPADCVDCVDHILNQLYVENYLEKRLSVDGKPVWGQKNKLAVHTASGIAVDFFATTKENWWNALVCRTGGQRSNLQLAMAANKKGWSFEAYGCGFKHLRTGQHIQMFSEEEIFKFVGLPYREPCLRP